MIRGVVLVLLTALLLATPAAEARPAGAAMVKKKLTCKRAKRMHVRKLGRRERKRVLAVRRRCAKAKRKAASAPGTSPSAPSAGGGTNTPPPDTPTPDDPDYTAPPPDDNPHALQVVSGEFYLNLSKGSVLSGPVRVEFNNAFAEDPHDLHLVRQDGTGPSYAFGTLKAGRIEARTLDLSAGSWQLFCALPEHASRGMTARLTVTQ
jgi:hypothetical protein